MKWFVTAQRECIKKLQRGCRWIGQAGSWQAGSSTVPHRHNSLWQGKPTRETTPQSLAIALMLKGVMRTRIRKRY